MDPRFLIHNSHLEDPSLFETLDPQLRRLRIQTYLSIRLIIKIACRYTGHL